MRRGKKRLLFFSALAAAALLFVAPILFMVAGSLKPDERVLVEAGSLRAFWPEGASLQNYRDVFERVAFGRFLFNSLFIALAVTALGLAVNAPAGYAFARLAWRGRKAAFALVTSLLIIPFEAIAVPLFYQAALLGWRDTYAVQIVPFAANAFSIYLFYTFFLGLPRELEEAARVDGATEIQVFFGIMIPYIMGTIITVWTTVVIFTLKIFDVVWVMTGGQYGTHVVATQFYRQAFTARNSGFGSAIAIVLLITVIPVMIYNLRQFRQQEAF